MSTCAQPRDAVDRRRAGVAARRADDRDPLAPLGEHVVEQPPDELQGDVLERQRRAVEQLLQPELVVDLHERHDRRVAERRVRLRRTAAAASAASRSGLDERQHDLDRTVDVGARTTVDRRTGGRERRPGLAARTARRRWPGRRAGRRLNPSSGAAPRVETYRIGQPPITRSRPPTLRTTSSSRSSRTVAWTSASRASWVMNTSRASGPLPSCSATRMLTRRARRTRR